MATKRKRDPGKPYGPATREKKESLFTVKLGLNKFCIDPDLRETIADAARQVSLMTFELGKLLNLHFLLVCEQPGAYMHHLGRNDFYTVVQGVSTKESSCDVRDLSDCASSAVSSVMEAQHIYLSLRPPQLRWGSRSRVGNPLKFSCQAFWDNCSQDQMMNFERRLAQWWQGQVFRHANSHNNSAAVRNRLCKALVQSSKRGLTAFGVPSNTRLTSEEIMFIKKKLQESRDAADRDHVHSHELPHPIPHDRPYAELHPAVFTEDFDRQLQAFWPAYLRWSWRMLTDIHLHKQQLREQEQLEEQETDLGRPRQKHPRSQTWSIIPNRGWGCSSIQIDSVGLAGLLGSQKLETPLGADGHSLWWAFFNLDKVVNQQHRPPNHMKTVSTTGHRFWGSIRSDGVSCSVILHRPTRTAREVQAERICEQVGADRKQYVPELPAFVRLVALDPGPKDPVIGVVDGDSHGAHNIIHVSGKQFRAEAWFGRAKQRSKSRLVKSAGMQELQTLIPSYHTPHVEELCIHLQYVLSHLEELRGHAGHRAVLKDRWTAYIAKQKAVHRMCEVVVGDGEEHTVVAFGAARCGHLKGHRGPVKLVHDALCRYPWVTVYDVDEYYTSQVCSRCTHRSLGNVRYRNQRRPLHYVQRCSNPLCGALWNRDINASRNILAAFKSSCSAEGRVQYLCRPVENNYSD